MSAVCFKIMMPSCGIRFLDSKGGHFMFCDHDPVQIAVVIRITAQG